MLLPAMEKAYRPLVLKEIVMVILDYMADKN